MRVSRAVQYPNGSQQPPLAHRSSGLASSTMSYNWNHVIDSLAPSSSSAAPRRPSQERSPHPPHSPTPGQSTSPSRCVCESHPVLLQPLPPSLTLEKESRAQSELELDRQATQRRRERELAEALQDAHHEVERIQAREEVGTWARLRQRVQRGSVSEASKAGMPFVHPPQAYELYAAIDNHNLDYIARVRDQAFNLLLQKHGGEFPIVYASRIGPTHRDVVILLVGAFSRYVNNLDEDDFKKKETLNTLKALRANVGLSSSACANPRHQLKLAIDNALATATGTSQSNLLSSYMQVLIMSEGDSWIHRSTHDLGLVLRSPDSSPLAEAESMVRKFATKELRGVTGGVSDVEDYIANATLDLVIMAAWSVAATQMDVEPLPVSPQLGNPCGTTFS